MDLKAYDRDGWQWFEEEYIAPVHEAFGLCESPIETAVLWALIRQDGNFHCYGWMPVWDMPGVDENAGYMTLECSIGNDRTTIWPQVEIASIDGKSYRLDFLVEFHTQINGVAARVLLDVECDGHDFHERTKEQAERDKARDRDMQALGYRVARFTGSEIARSPESVASKIRYMAWHLAEADWRLESSRKG